MKEKKRVTQEDYIRIINTFMLFTIVRLNEVYKEHEKDEVGRVIRRTADPNCGIKITVEFSVGKKVETFNGLEIEKLLRVV